MISVAAPVRASGFSVCSRPYYVVPARLRAGPDGMDQAVQWEALGKKIADLGFDSILAPPLWSTTEDAGYAPDDPDRTVDWWDGARDMELALSALAAACSRHNLRLILDLPLGAAARGGRLATEHAAWYHLDPGRGLDPRYEIRPGEVPLREFGDEDGGEFVDAWVERLSRWVSAGVAGFRCMDMAALSPAHWGALIAGVRASAPSCCFLAWTPGMTPKQVSDFAGRGFDATFSSLPWWDGRASWLVEEENRLEAVAPVISPISDPWAPEAIDGDSHPGELLVRLCAAVIAGDGILFTMGMEDKMPASAIAWANRQLALRRNGASRLHLLSGSLAPYTVLFRSGRGILVNHADGPAEKVDWAGLRSRLPDGYADFHLETPEVDTPRNCLFFMATPAQDIAAPTPPSDKKRRNVSSAMRAPRIVIENVSPSADQGSFSVKRAVGERVRVQADVFMDGHDQLGVRLLWRTADTGDWRQVRMKLVGNDRWQADIWPTRVGRHFYTVQAWRDNWGSFRDQLEKKVQAEQDVSLEIEEGRLLLSKAMERVRESEPPVAHALMHLLGEVGMPHSPPRRRTRRSRPAVSGAPDEAAVFTPPPAESGQIRRLLSDETQALMREAEDHSFETTCATEYPLMVERRKACYASWYELFPRSQSARPGAHGTFDDVIERLPAIAAMGFDVLYFPPIHPIGRTNRKGKNNSLHADADEPGSPYAIGAKEGGHDAIHPELGTLHDFQRLLAQARGHGLEVALDFAIQCSPDHPWLKDHPEWFAWRADGSLRYAENPPKRYEDIVGPDFYSERATASRQAALWQRLRDVVLFWVDQGVRMFRVDNPHTKPLPFWQWLISEVKSMHPDTLFLSEAFTRPKMMYRLAKIGFSQSYTYFTWRNEKQEIIDYLTELSTPPVAEFFRPHFFVNTPDINPFFLQRSGRPGFLIRAALAATTSGLWGMYNGFEVCEARALPGREEYLDSEKYEIRCWDWDRPGNIVAEITQLNLLRRTNPALQTHLGIRFHRVDDDHLLFFSKSTLQGDNVVLAVISLDPHTRRAAMMELPLWLWNLPDDATVQFDDLLTGQRFALTGKHHWITIAPERPYLLWRLAPTA